MEESLGLTPGSGGYLGDLPTPPGMSVRGYGGEIRCLHLPECLCGHHKETDLVLAHLALYRAMYLPHICHFLPVVLHGPNLLLHH